MDRATRRAIRRKSYMLMAERLRREGQVSVTEEWAPDGTVKRTTKMDNSMPGEAELLLKMLSLAPPEAAEVVDEAKAKGILPQDGKAEPAMPTEEVVAEQGPAMQEDDQADIKGRVSEGNKKDFKRAVRVNRGQPSGNKRVASFDERTEGEEFGRAISRQRVSEGWVAALKNLKTGEVEWGRPGECHGQVYERINAENPNAKGLNADFDFQEGFVDLEGDGRFIPASEMRDQFGILCTEELPSYQTASAAKTAYRSYSGDPFWMKLKYPSSCKRCGRQVPAGEEMFRFKDGSMYCDSPECGQKESSSFDSAAQDEDMMGGGMMEYGSKKIAQSTREYLEMFFEEKQLAHQSWDIEGPDGTMHFIDSDVVIEALLNAPASEQEQAANIIRKIDFMNGDVNHFLKHLAKGLVENYGSAFASKRVAFTFPQRNDCEFEVSDFEEVEKNDDEKIEIMHMLEEPDNFYRNELPEALQKWFGTGHFGIGYAPYNTKEDFEKDLEEALDYRDMNGAGVSAVVSAVAQAVAASENVTSETIAQLVKQHMTNDAMNDYLIDRFDAMAKYDEGMRDYSVTVTCKWSNPDGREFEGKAMTVNNADEIYHIEQKSGSEFDELANEAFQQITDKIRAEIQASGQQEFAFAAIRTALRDWPSDPVLLAYLLAKEQGYSHEEAMTLTMRDTGKSREEVEQAASGYYAEQRRNFMSPTSLPVAANMKRKAHDWYEYTPDGIGVGDIVMDAENGGGKRYKVYAISSRPDPSFPSRTQFSVLVRPEDDPDAMVTWIDSANAKKVASLKRKAGYSTRNGQKSEIESLYESLRLVSTNDQSFRKPSFNKVNDVVSIGDNGSVTVFVGKYQGHPFGPDDYINAEGAGNWYELEGVPESLFNRTAMKKKAYKATYNDGQEAMVGDTIQTGEYEGVVRAIYDTNTLEVALPGGEAVRYSNEPTVKLLRRASEKTAVKKEEGAVQAPVEVNGINDTKIQTWFERDRQHVALVDAETEQNTIIEWWDEAVTEAVEDGFLESSDWHGSAYQYAKEQGLLIEVPYKEDPTEDMF